MPLSLQISPSDELSPPGWYIGITRIEVCLKSPYFKSWGDYR